jgi:hypothetical protein
MLLGLGAAVDPKSVVEPFVPPVEEAAAALPKSEFVVLAGSLSVWESVDAGLAPNRVEDCITVDGAAAIVSVGLLSEPNIFDAGAGVAFPSSLASVVLSVLACENGLKAGLAGSASFAVSVDGLAPNKDDPNVGCEVGAIVSNGDFFGACASFSLSDSPPSLSASAVGAALSEPTGSFEADSSGFAAPKRVDDVDGFGEKMELGVVAALLPNMDVLAVVPELGANFSGVVLGFQV